MGIRLEFLRAAVHRPTLFGVAFKDRRQALSDLPAHFEQVHEFPGTGGTFHFELVAIVEMEMQQRPDDQGVDGHPDRPTPVRVATEHSGVGFRRQILDTVFFAMDMKEKRMLQMVAGQGADSVRTQESLLVKQAREHTAKLRLSENREQTPPLHPRLVRRSNRLRKLRISL